MHENEDPTLSESSKQWSANMAGTEKTGPLRLTLSPRSGRYDGRGGQQVSSLALSIMPHPCQILDEALKICNYIFTIIFVLESVFKLVAFGFRRFFQDR